MRLIEKQRLFCRLLGELIVWGNSAHLRSPLWDTPRYAHNTEAPRVALRMAEGYVGDSIPHIDAVWSGPALYGNKAPSLHRRDGGHFNRLAQDLVLDVNGRYITDGSHPAWLLLGEHWEKMHPLCRWGGRWGDANHFSLEHGGVK